MKRTWHCGVSTAMPELLTSFSESFKYEAAITVALNQPPARAMLNGQI
jgi:hypothetical protein